MSDYIFNPIYPNAKFKTFCYIKSVVTNPNIIVGEEVKRLIPLLTDSDFKKIRASLKQLLK